MNLAELLEIPASIAPEQEIIRFEGRGTRYSELQERVQRTAGALRALGVRGGDRVAVLQTNTCDLVESLFAIVSLGAVFVPLNYRAAIEEWSQMLDVVAPRVLLAGERYLDPARELSLARSDRPLVVSLSKPAGDSQHLEALAARSEPAEIVDVADEHLAALMFTSGTTAAAKAVMLTHADLVSYVCNSADCADGSDRGSVLISAPLYHIAGLTGLLTAIFAGRRIVLMRQFDASEWLRLLAGERITHAFLVPTMLKRVLDEPMFPTTDLSSLQTLSYGAAPMPLGVIRRAIQAFPPSVLFLNAFGQTETTSTVTVLGPDDHRLVGSPEEMEQKLRRLGSIGRPLPDVEIRILDEHGVSLLPTAIGEIAVRTGRLMQGYFGQENATSTAIRDGWLRTRDLGWIDEDGYVFLAGRMADLIIRGGENIAPQEVEMVLESHPAVDEAAVIGVPDEDWGERVAAVVVIRPGAHVAAETLTEFCRQRLASFKKPDFIIFAEVLPRNSLGKLLRNELRAQYGGTLATEEGPLYAQ